MSSTDNLSRLNRAIASTGFCSRRKADQLIADGRVTVNGVVKTEFNTLVDLDCDDLKVDGRPIQQKEKQYIALHKPRGVLTTCEDELGRTTILDLLEAGIRHLKPVGRLDRDSEGLLILTNDGDLAFKLAHPTGEVWKKYHVEVDGAISDDAVRIMRDGIMLEEGRTRPAKISDLVVGRDKSTFHISISEGKNRQIRRMCAYVGYPVIRLVRVAIGRLQLEPLGPGEWRRLSRQEIETECLNQGKE